MRIFAILVLDMIAVVCIVLQKSICMRFSEMEYFKSLLDIGSGFLLSIALGFSIYCSTACKQNKEKEHMLLFRITIFHIIAFFFYYIYIYIYIFCQ